MLSRRPAPPRRPGPRRRNYRQELRREARSLVADEQRNETVTGARRERHGARTMAQRVVDEIAERLLDPEPVGLDRETR